jgi:hypothetical protein
MYYTSCGRDTNTIMSVTRKRRRIKLGDVFEIITPKGSAFFQYTHQNKQMGALIRILEGIWARKPENIGEAVNGRHTFQVFFPLQAAANLGVVTFIGNYPIPAHAKEFPIFRYAGIGNASGEIPWALWDGEKWWWVQLTEEIRKLPLKAIVNDTMLIHKIVNGWLPELDNSKYLSKRTVVN